MRFSNLFLNASKNQKQYSVTTGKKISKLLIADLGQETFESVVSRSYTEGIKWLKTNPQQATAEEIVNAFHGVVKAGFFYLLAIEEVLPRDKLLALVPYTIVTRELLSGLLALPSFEELIKAFKTYRSEVFTKEIQKELLKTVLQNDLLPPNGASLPLIKIFDLSVTIELLLEYPDFVHSHGRKLVEELPDDISSVLVEQIPKLKLWYQNTNTENISWKELLFGEKYTIIKNSTAMSFGEVERFYSELLDKYASIIPHTFELLDAIMQNMEPVDATQTLQTIWYNNSSYGGISNSDWNTFFEKYPKILTIFFNYVGIFERAYSFKAWWGFVKNVYDDNENYAFRNKISYFDTLLKSTASILPDVHKELKVKINELLSMENLSKDLNDVAPSMISHMHEYTSVLGEEKAVNILNQILEKDDAILHSILIEEPFYVVWSRLTDQIGEETLSFDLKLKLLRAVKNASSNLSRRMDDVFKEEDLALLAETPEITGAAANLLNDAPKEAMRRLFFANKNFTPEECKTLFVNSWKMSSRTPAANSVQLVLTQMEEFNGERTSNIYFNARTPKHFSVEILDKFISPEARTNIQQFLKDVYSRTQASLLQDITRDQNLDYDKEKNLLHLYRGVEELYNVSAPLESWTSKKTVAHGFDGADILEAWVPLNAVYVSWLSPDWETEGVSSEGLKESEYILIASKFSFKVSDQTEGLDKVFRSEEMRQVMDEWFDSVDGKITELQPYLDSGSRENVSFILQSIVDILKVRLYRMETHLKVKKLLSKIKSKVTNERGFKLALYNAFKSHLLPTFLQRLSKNDYSEFANFFDTAFADLAHTAMNEFSDFST